MTAQAEPVAEYELHTRITAETGETLKKTALIAQKMGFIDSPTLCDLFNLYVIWGQAIMKSEWLKRMGY